MTAQNIPLCVDLDGTLVATDTLFESVLLLLKQNPLALFSCLRWGLQGRAVLKREVARRVALHVETLPYTVALRRYIEDEDRAGRPLYLATAAAPTIAEAVAKHVGLFSGVIASDTRNLKGEGKALALIERFGEKGFLYAGNSMVDVPVWQAAAGAIVVNAPERVAAAAAAVAPIVTIFPPPSFSLAELARLMRWHQWVKNLLVFVPVLAAHLLTVSAFARTGVAFVAFCAVASAVYILNDMLDLSADRQHPRKRERPLARGTVSLPLAGLISMGLLAGGLLLSFFSSGGLLGWLLAYGTVTTLYSWYLKRIIIVDVIILANLYTVRIFAGAAAVGVQVSVWLFAFALFLFMSLALLKRYADTTHVGRGYRSSHKSVIGVMGPVAGVLALLVLGLYIQSAEVRLLYTQPVLLWGVVLLVGFWLGRVWRLAYQGQMHDDPVIFAVRDIISYAVVFLSLLIVGIAA